MPETRKYTVADLFAGVGGLSYGFSRNDRFEIILANEMQKDIAKAYTLNHPSVNMLQGDIKDLSEDILRQAIGNRTVDVVVGGPPCQSYSTLGKRQMDARANLFMVIRKLIFAKYSQDPTHFCRCVDEIAQTLEEQGDKEGARAIRNTSRDGYVKSYYEASRQTQPPGSPFVSYKPAFVIDNKDIALWHAKNGNPPMRVRHILEYVENGEVVGKDVLEYDANTDKWHRVEAECIELV